MTRFPFFPYRPPRHAVFGLALIPLCVYAVAGDLASPLLARDSHVHLVFAVLSTAAYLFLLRRIFGPHGLTAWGLAGVFTFTGLVGMLVLSGLQWLAEQSRTTSLHGSFDASFLWQLGRLIDFSYQSALDPGASFWRSFFGYTFGIGLCEEFVKILPVWFVLDRLDHFDRRDALIVGIASGIGFGVAEGNFYSEHFYNGNASIVTYSLRFVSCVALHAAFTGVATLLIERRRVRIFEHDNLLFVTVMVLVGCFPAMLLHGLYDACLKFDHFGLAIVAALSTFAALSFLIESERQRETSATPADAFRDEVRRIRAKIARGGMDALSQAEFETLRKLRRPKRRST